MKCYLRRTIFGLAGEDALAEEALSSVKLGEWVQVEIKKPRNAKHHRLFWLMVTKLARSLGLKPQEVADVLKIRTGHYTLIETKDGQQLKLPRSISWAAMDQQAFASFFDDCCREICFAWLPHMTPGKWRREVLQMMGIDWKEEDDGDDVQHQNFG